MVSFDSRIAALPYLPSVSGSVTSSPTTRRNTARGTVSGRAHTPPTSTEPSGDAAPKDNDLDYLTDSDRDLIHAVTGEVIEPGQRPQDRPLSAFAMQIAVDRKCGALRAGLDISAGYLRRTNRLLLQLKVPSNPFSGPILDKALGYLERLPGMSHSGAGR
jgi:hypothetical protein